MNAVIDTTAEFGAPRPRRRASLAELLRKGIATAPSDGVCVGGYYERGATPDEGDPHWFLDPIMLIFVGKFGLDILATIGAEHRVETYTEARVWDREHVFERLTKAVNGGVWEFHKRLDELPLLYRNLVSLGYRTPAGALPVVRKNPSAFVSVFRAITFMSDTLHLPPAQIADVLEECRV